MTTLFENCSVRSEGDLLSDLNACRQLRHLTDKEKRTIVKECFDKIYYISQSGRYHTINLELPYGNKGKCSVVWCSDSFEIAIKRHGYQCDTCDRITMVSEEKTRIASERILANLDGRVKLMLCSYCSGRYRRFCQWTFGESAGSPYNPDTEKKMLAFLAKEITIAYDQYAAQGKTYKVKKLKEAVDGQPYAT